MIRLPMIGLAIVAFFSIASPILVQKSAAEDVLVDSAQEDRARRLMEELRCVVCQSQSIADSEAQIAADMRRLVRERVVAGESDQQIIDYLVSRYGDFVRFRPPFKRSTWILWLGPFAVLLIALGAGAIFFLRRKVPAPTALSDQEQARLAALLNLNSIPSDPRAKRGERKEGSA